MRTVLSWLCDFADFGSLVDEKDPSYLDQLVTVLATAMNNRGFVVEGIERVGFNLENIVVAKVLEIQAIEGANRIRKISVDIGQDQPEVIVCGAFNFDVGDFVPLAKVGAVLPGGFAISARRMKGVASNGMLCSSKELGLGDDSDGLLILDPGLEVGATISSALRIIPDVVFDLAIEANRPDANCHMGVAKELAVHFDLEFRMPDITDISNVKVEELSSDRLGSSGVGALLLATFESTRELSVDDKVVRRLVLAGMRSVSPVVDASNYVMLELGQPTHPYDLNTLKSNGIGVRSAYPNEKVTTLDGQTRTLGITRNPADPSVDLVIVNDDDCPVGIAGIMGGASSEISSMTDAVLLEVANFSRELISKTSKKLGLRSEASARFERGVDPKIIDLALGRFCEILSTTPTLVARASKVPNEAVVVLRKKQVERILGQTLPLEELFAALVKMGFLIDPNSFLDELIRVVIPSNRHDISIESDLIEELARHYGYHRITRRELGVARVGRLTVRQIVRREIIDFSVARGYYEGWTSTLLGPDEQKLLGDQRNSIRVTNPMAIEESVLRRSLLTGLLKSVGANLRRQSAQVKLFEVGRVFSHKSEEGDQSDQNDYPNESERIAFISYQADSESNVAFELYTSIEERFSLDKEVVFRRISSLEDESLMTPGFFGMHPSRSVAMLVDDRVVGVAGELDPYAASQFIGQIKGVISYLELDLSRAFYDRVATNKDVSVSIFPSAQFDLSFSVPKELLSIELLREIESAISSYSRTVFLIDAYVPGSQEERGRSLTYRVVVTAMDHTLVDSEIRAIRQTIIDQVFRSGLGQLRE